MPFRKVLYRAKNALAFRVRKDGARFEKTKTTAVPQPADGYLGEYVSSLSGVSGEKPGFMVLERGSDSLKARLALILSAEKTLDLQYYAISNDLTSNLLIEAVIRAAERGVRVRFLIDDISVGKVYKNLLFLDSIDNIEIRIFNPISTGNQAFLARFVEFFARLKKTRMRMHNKAIIADNLACMTGGRNLGDEYFDTHAAMTFKDIDALSVGSVVESVSESFDAFWNASGSWPLEYLYGRLWGKRYARRVRKRLMINWSKAAGEEDGASLSARLGDFVEKSGKSLVFADAQFVYDPPAKIEDHNAKNKETPHQGVPMSVIRPVAQGARDEFLVVSPYFVPYGGDLDWMEEMAASKVRVRVLTNSLASTDVVAVHTGYAPQRKRLLESGIELYELKPHGQKRTRQRIFGRGAPSYASLHAKVYVIDAKTSVIGSLNFDPRSLHLNTETALIIESVQLSRELRGLFDEAATPEASHRMILSPMGTVLYRTKHKGRIRDYRSEPECSLWRKLQYLVFSLLPVKEEL